MFLKYFMYLSSLFLENTNNGAVLENQTLILIKKTIRNEILYTAFNILIGIILSSVIIYSLFQVAKNFQIYLQQFENKLAIETASFSATALISFALIFYLLKKDTTHYKHAFQEETAADKLKIVSLNFIQGALKGFNSKYKKLNTIAEYTCRAVSAGITCLLCVKWERNKEF